MLRWVRGQVLPLKVIATGYPSVAGFEATIEKSWGGKILHRKGGNGSCGPL
jgi:hypothetical protein